MADLEGLAAKMKVLSDAYAAQLPERFAQLEQEWRKLPRDEWNDEGFMTLHRMVHSLTGSGKTFGFATLSDLSRKLEDDLEQFAQAKIVLSEAQRGYVEKAIAELRQSALHQDA